MLVTNLATAFGTLAETVELWLAIIMMLGGIVLTHLIQKWADSTSNEQPSAVNVGQGGTERFEENTMRD
jgi:threonine/homoserine/homoserine lactone efflux protein